MASEEPELSGTQASLLAKGALDHALSESCTVALALLEEAQSLPKGPVASFDSGMAAALCGDQPYALKTAVYLQQNFPRNTLVLNRYVPELQTAAEIGINEPNKALPYLNIPGQADESLFATYLRGMAHAAVGQASQAASEFESVSIRRGEAAMQQGDLLPMAEIDLARAYRSSHDQPESVEAYRSFLKLWESSDQKQSLVAEALAHTK